MNSCSVIKRQVSIPLVANVPHSSAFIPGDARDPFALSDAELEAEILRMTDWYVHELFLPVVQLGGVMVRYDVSRLVVDPERFEDDAEEVMATKGQGVIYTHDSHGNRLRTSDPSKAEREALLERFYRPYHRAAEDEVTQMLERFGRCLILDCHSFPLKPLPYEFDQDPDRPDICLGTDSFHTPDSLLEQVELSLKKHHLSTARNRPFAGTYVPLAFHQKDQRVWSIMLEVNRKLYMSENAGDKLGCFEETEDAITSVVRTLANFRDSDQE
jgi:N-formylglutamate amidohydrolase